MNILTLINFQFNVLKDMALNKWMFHLFTNQVAGFYYFVNINIQITNVRQEAFVFCLRHLEKNGGDKIPLPLENTGKLNVTKKKRKMVVLHITYSNKFYVFYITTNNFLTTGYLANY